MLPAVTHHPTTGPGACRAALNLYPPWFQVWLTTMPSGKDATHRIVSLCLCQCACAVHAVLGGGEAPGMRTTIPPEKTLPILHPPIEENALLRTLDGFFLLEPARCAQFFPM